MSKARVILLSLICVVWSLAPILSADEIPLNETIDGQNTSVQSGNTPNLDKSDGQLVICEFGVVPAGNACTGTVQGSQYGIISDLVIFVPTLNDSLVFDHILVDLFSDPEETDHDQADITFGPLVPNPNHPNLRFTAEDSTGKATYKPKMEGDPGYIILPNGQVPTYVIQSDTDVPEPSSLTLLGSGLLGLVGMVRRRNAALRRRTG